MTNLARALADFLKVDEKEASTIIQKAKAGGEINEEFSGEQWFEERLRPNTVFISKDDYAQMCTSALLTLQTTTATDFGSSRQRDYFQIWADTTRGYLGEKALVKRLSRLGIETELAHQQGEIEEFLDSDIAKVRDSQSGEMRTPRIKVGVKTAKWNGIWLDIPGAQFDHSDCHVFAKVGAGREHLVAYFKSISVFRDKVLAEGMRINSFSASEAKDLYDSMPDFKAIPAYLCGIVQKKDVNPDISQSRWNGSFGRLHYTIKEWHGFFDASYHIPRIKEENNSPPEGKVKWEGIGEFSHDRAAIFNAGSLVWSPDDWSKLANSL